VAGDVVAVECSGWRCSGCGDGDVVAVEYEYMM